MAGIKFSQLPVASILNAADLVAIEQGGVSKGLPASAIVEYGSNSNGKYAQFAGGTQICWLPNISPPTLWTFPAQFLGDQTTSFVSHTSSVICTSSYTTSGVAVQGVVVNISDGSINSTENVDVLAIGRWY